MGDWIRPAGPTALVLAKLRSLEVEVYNYREVLAEIVGLADRGHGCRAVELARQALRPPGETVERDRWAGVERQTI